MGVLVRKLTSADLNQRFRYAGLVCRLASLTETNEAELHYNNGQIKLASYDEVYPMPDKEKEIKPHETEARPDLDAIA